MSGKISLFVGKVGNGLIWIGKGGNRSGRIGKILGITVKIVGKSVKV
ncbi:Uncharacterised protein [Niallia circulans]|nr:Uncharacterised protein [Niallia circulans]